MKILVLSLLRIGDIVLSAGVLRALREKHPKAEIDLLVNAQFAQIAPLLPYIDNVIPFDREGLQRGLGEAGSPVFDSYERLSATIDDLDSRGYDWIINLTHNRLSGWLMNVLNAETKTGLCLDAEGRAGFGSSWFRFLNEQVGSEGHEVFHFADVFRFALDLDETPLKTDALVETAAGWSEANEFLALLDTSRAEGAAAISSAKPIVVQALTSDTKKDWALDNYAATIEQIARVHQDASFALLCAPFEKARVEPFAERLRANGVNARLAVLSFEGAFSLLKRSRLLVSGDTSIKHLACAARTPIVELSLGSADPYRTGAYLHDSIIIKSRESCAPCVHSRPCHRSSHACGERVPVSAVAMIVSEVYAGRRFQLRTIAEEFRSEIEILRVDMRSSGFWAAHSVLEPFTEATVGRWIDLACRKIWFETSGDRTWNAMGTEVVRLSRLLKTIHPGVSDIEWRQLLEDFERQAQTVESRVNGFKVGLQYLRGCYEDPRRMKDFVRGLMALRERVRPSPLLQSFRSLLDQVIEDDISPAFTRYRRIGDLVAEIEARTDIHLRLIRGLAFANKNEKGLEKT